MEATVVEPYERPYETAQMRIERRFTIPVFAFLILLGLAMAFDQKFISFSDMRRNVLIGFFVYLPTAIFAFIALLQFRRGRTWPAVAFAAGLIGTGLFHQYVAGFSDGNPGYMMPAGHIIAPLVSIVVYSISFLVVWAIARATQRMSGANTQSDQEGT